ncbi:MAG: hypothetical protein LBT86_02765 [Deltaproteobacteria bacterium]|jgi:hypothetical protein|nr:hypothetical protein [Deltaproteobacteria bacterium]
MANDTNICATLTIGVYVDVKDLGFVSIGQAIIPKLSYPTEEYLNGCR